MRLIVSVCFLFTTLSVHAQVANDECNFATFLGSITEYCSDVSEFSNADATLSAEAIPFCWFGGAAHDVWFSFVPTAPAVYVQLIGKLDISDPNILNPSLVIYSGNCNNLVEEACNSISQGTNIAELTINNVVIGQVYYIRVDAENASIGNFGLCIESFTPIPSPESDCPDAVILCDKSPFQVQNLNSVGSIPNEMTGPCINTIDGQDFEEASVWYTWTCAQSGTLTFTLTPNNPNSQEEDLDFIVYELPGGLDDCDNRVALRCMLSGRTAGNTDEQNAPCFGPTGLREGETDTEEFAGCDQGDNNFLAPLDMVAGQSYGIIINNFSQSGFGFSIEFGGTGTFLGPEPDFDIVALEAFECDKTIRFDDLSSTMTDSIVSWTWNFGSGAEPLFNSGEGPHLVEYASFGDKLVALTIETERGCQVTKILDIFVEPCCQDTSTLDVTVEPTDLICFGVPTGSILASGISGSPEYNFSIDGLNFQPSPLFSELESGTYEVFIQDQKGCINMTTVFIDEPPPLVVDAGPDLTVDLGFSGTINATYMPPVPVTISWSPTDGLSCTDCLDPEVVPPGTTTYTITIEDAVGCRAQDQVTVEANIIRPVYAPNVFTPDNDGINDHFYLGFGPQAEFVEEICIFDRWGNLVYTGAGNPNDPTLGWDGNYDNTPVNPGVFAWLARVRFIDGEVLNYSGDITVLR